MKELSERFISKGFEFNQILRNKVGYMYEKRLNSKVVGYEVFLRKENTQFNCISYPRDNAFGVWAWSFYDENRALSKFSSLSLEKYNPE